MRNQQVTLPLPVDGNTDGAPVVVAHGVRSIIAGTSVALHAQGGTLGGISPGFVMLRITRPSGASYVGGYPGVGYTPLVRTFDEPVRVEAFVRRYVPFDDGRANPDGTPMTARDGLLAAFPDIAAVGVDFSYAMDNDAVRLE